MRGGLVFFRGAGAAARAYLESDHSHADEYYLESGSAVANWVALDATGSTLTRAQLDGEQYQGWVDWRDPATGASRGIPRDETRVREDGSVKSLPASPRFVEMTVNCDKSLSVAAALDPRVSAALDAAQANAVDAMNRYMAEHSVTRVGPRGGQRLVNVQRLESVAVVHRSSRAGDPHRHVHVQWSTRVFAEGKWRGLHTGATLKQQGALRGVGEAAIHGHDGLRAALAEAGFEFDAASGTVTNLAEQTRVMSKRATQIERNVERFESEWRREHPGAEPDAALRRRWDQQAWAFERPRKRHESGLAESRWISELRDAGLQVDGFRGRPATPLVSLVEVDRARVIEAAVTAAEARGSAWSIADLEGHVGVAVAAQNVAASSSEIGAYVRDVAEQIATTLPRLELDVAGHVPEWVRNLTSDRVVRIESELRAAFDARGTQSGLTFTPRGIDGLDAQQAEAACAIATRAPLVVIEGAAGSGKTTMLGAARTLAEADGMRLVVVVPTLRAAQEAATATGAHASSAHRLAYEYGFRWTEQGVWSRITVGEEMEPGEFYQGPREEWRLDANARIVIDEAGMVDQDLAHALMTLADETGASVALIGDRQQLPAVGRGGVLDMAVAAHPRPLDMAEVHRFREDGYAELSNRMRERDDPAALFDTLLERNNLVVHDDARDVRDHIVADVVARAEAGASVAVAVTSNEQAAEINALVQDAHARAGHTREAGRAVTGSDALTLRIGDRVMTRKNRSDLKVANRDVWKVQRVHRDGSVTVADGARTARLPQAYVQESVHLAYASTVYGVQGATVDYAHSIVDESTSAQSLYVAATRGRHHNAIHIVAESRDDAAALFVDAMGRESGDRGLAVAGDAARRDLDGLVLPEQVASRALRQERRRIESVQYAHRLQEWQRQAEAWEARHPGVTTDRYAAQLERANAEQRQAAAAATSLREQITGDAVRAHESAWARDWKLVRVAQQRAESASVFTRKAAQQQAREAFDAFSATHKVTPSAKPMESDRARWAREAIAQSREYALAVRAKDDATERRDELAADPPRHGERPTPPREGSEREEAARDAAYVQAERAQEQQRQEKAESAASAAPARERAAADTRSALDAIERANRDRDRGHGRD